MTRKHFSACFTQFALVIATAWFLVAPSRAHAQFRGGRDAKEYIRGKDRNGNGLLEPDELSGRAKEVLERVGGSSGLDLSKPIPVDRAIQVFEAANPESSGGSRGGPWGGPGTSSSTVPATASSSPAPSSSSSTAVATNAAAGAGATAGFGELPKVPKTAGFSDAGLGLNAVAIESRFDRRVLDYVARLFREFDRSQNQILEDAEIRGAGGLIDREADTNKDGFITKTELCERINQKWAASSTGAAANAARSAPRSSASASTGGSSGGSNADEAQRVRRYAEGLLKQYDENKNGQLEKNEWSQARSITRETDANNDGVITLDELVTKLANFGKESSSSSSTASSSASTGRPGESSSSGGGGGWGGRPRDPSQNGKNGPEKNVGYRQRSALEKLPKGLPDWFTRNDANEDGQVTMAEFATGWTEAKAAEFAGFDLNRDGVVTPTECLKSAEKAKLAGSSGRSSDRGSYGSSSSGASSYGASSPGASSYGSGSRDRGGWGGSRSSGSSSSSGPGGSGGFGAGRESRDGRGRSDNPGASTSGAPSGSEKPADKPEDKPAEKADDKPAEKPADGAADKPAEKSAEKPADKPADNPPNSGAAPAAPAGDAGEKPADPKE